MARSSQGVRRNGDSGPVFPYEELRGLAAHLIAVSRAEQAFSAAGLVHEAYLRMVRHHHETWASAALLYAAGARTMRHILIENARRAMSLRRGAGQSCLCLDESVLAPGPLPDHLMAVNSALDELAAVDPFKARLVELRFFNGLTVQESGKMLGVSGRSIKRHWAGARAWLHQRLSDGAQEKTGHSRAQ